MPSNVSETAVRLAGGTGGAAVLGPLLATMLDALERGTTERGGPVPPGEPHTLARRWLAELGEVLPDFGVGAAHALAEMTTLVAAGAADPADPACAGHLHCPPLAVAVAADAAVSALNPSQDSWDQAPVTTVLEERVLRVLAGLVGYDPRRSAGVLTTGGSESNLMGLLLARDHAVARHFGVSVTKSGQPAAATGRLRVLVSTAAHFSVARAAGFLGLGEDAVIGVPTDAGHRMDPAALRWTLDRLRAKGDIPVAVVATAGTTDLGAIDPLPQLADLAAEYGTWLHVDAAYGGGAVFSVRLAPLLTGLERADSITLDLHKLGWQPVAAGVFLTADAAGFGPLARQVDYLNPADDEQAGYHSLLGRSLRTTRRADAVKIAVTLRALGRGGLAALTDHCHGLAAHAAERIVADPRLELYADPVLTTVVFRYLPAARVSPAATDTVNARLRRALLAAGRAVVGRTTAVAENGRAAVYLKLTLLNPAATPGDVDALLDAVVAAGEHEAGKLEGEVSP